MLNVSKAKDVKQRCSLSSVSFICSNSPWWESRQPAWAGGSMLGSGTSPQGAPGSRCWWWTPAILHIANYSSVAFGEIDVNSGDGDGNLCTGLSLPVWGGEGEAIVCPRVKGKNLLGMNSLSNCSFHHCPREIQSLIPEHTLWWSKSGVCSKDGWLPC